MWFYSVSIFSPCCSLTVIMKQSIRVCEILLKNFCVVCCPIRKDCTLVAASGIASPSFWGVGKNKPLEERSEFSVLCFLFFLFFCKFPSQTTWNKVFWRGIWKPACRVNPSGKLYAQSGLKTHCSTSRFLNLDTVNHLGWKIPVRGCPVQLGCLATFLASPH